jgi:succinyl-CoA synthetase beta subunit
MNSYSPARRARGLALRALALMILGGGLGIASSGADTVTTGSSTATTTQSGGGASRTEVTRARDGHAVVTRDGNSTDITIQRRASGPNATVQGGAPAEPAAAAAVSEHARKRLDRRVPAAGSAGRGSEQRPPATRDGLRERIRSRMRR